MHAFVSLLHAAVSPSSPANLLHCLCMLRSSPAVLPTYYTRMSPTTPSNSVLLRRMQPSVVCDVTYKGHAFHCVPFGSEECCKFCEEIGLPGRVACVGEMRVALKGFL